MVVFKSDRSKRSLFVSALPSLILMASSGAFADSSICAQKHGSQICVSQGSKIIIKKGPQTFRTCSVQAVAADGSMSCYHSDDYSTEALNLNSADIVTTLESLDGLQQGAKIILRDAENTYVTYTVSTIYNDETIILYNSSTYASSYTSKDAILKRLVTTKEQIPLTYPTSNGPQKTNIQQGEKIILRISDKKYASYAVSTIYSDGIVSIYSLSDYTTSFIHKNDLAQKLVYTLNSAGPFQQGTNITLKEQDKVYKKYNVSTIYSDGIIMLYDLSNYQTSYRSLAELDRDDVTTLDQLTVRFNTINGPQDSVVKQGANILLKKGPGKYISHSVSTIYSDEEVVLYNSVDYSTAYYSKSELASMLVETIPSLGAFKVGVNFAVPNTGKDPLDRTSYYISNIYSDGTLSLYSSTDYSTSYKALAEMPSNYIQITGAIAPFKQGSLYLVKDKSGKTMMILPTQFYADRVMRFNIFSQKSPNGNKSALARVEDLTVLSTQCDATVNSCYNWWYQNSQSLSDSLPLQSLTYFMADLKVNVNIAKSATDSFQDGFVISNDKLVAGKAYCAFSKSGATAVLAGDKYNISDAEISESNVHIKSTNQNSELEIDCKFPSAAMTFGDLRHALGGYFSVVPRQR
jgi:hypothetical protein